MSLRLKQLLVRSIWVALVLGAFGFPGAHTVAIAQAKACALPRAVIAGETALRDALSRNDGNTAPLRAALTRLAQQSNGSPEVAAYLASRRTLAATISAGDGIAARRQMRTPPHQLAGQQALLAVRAEKDCIPDLSSSDTATTLTPRDGGSVTGGHGDTARAGTTSATGSGRTSQPGGAGIETSPLSFLRGFDATWHILPGIGATLAFGALIFGLTRDRRKYRRFICHMPVSVVGRDGAIESTMLDISQGGVKLTRADQWAKGARLKIRLDSETAPKSGRVVWANKGFVGVLFGKPLSTHEFQSILAVARAGAGAAERDDR